jgi:CheY-like chemotaxis protein
LDREGREIIKPVKQLVGVKILVVEDDDLLREMLVELFVEAKADVVDAPNGKEAFKIVQNSQIDIVVSDVRMPGGDGIELAKSIHLMSGKKPLIFICSGFHDMTAEMIREYKIIKVFTKPFDRHELISSLAEAVAK